MCVCVCMCVCYTTRWGSLCYFKLRNCKLASSVTPVVCCLATWVPFDYLISYTNTHTAICTPISNHYNRKLACRCLLLYSGGLVMPSDIYAMFLDSHTMSPDKRPHLTEAVRALWTLGLSFWGCFFMHKKAVQPDLSWAWMLPSNNK